MQLYVSSVRFMNSKDTSIAFLASMGIADPQKKPITLPLQLKKEFAQASAYFETHPDVFKLWRTNKEKFKKDIVRKHQFLTQSIAFLISTVK